MYRSFPQPNPRIGNHVHTLCQEDKFEVCLNLAPIVNALVVCCKHDAWQEFLEDPDRGIAITPEATAEFEYFDFSPDQVGLMHVSPLLPALIERDILSSAVMNPSLLPRVAREHHQAAEFITRHNTYIQMRHLSSCTLGELQTRNIQDISPWMDRIEQMPRQALNALAVVEDLQGALNELKRLQTQIDGPDRATRAYKRHKGEAEAIQLRSIKGYCYVMKEFIVLEYRNKTWLLPFVFFLELYGKITELSNLLIYLHFSTGTTFPENHWESALQFLSHCIAVLLRRRSNRPCQNQNHQQLENDNCGFLYMKTMEALGVGIISLREDKENFQEENRLLLDTMWRSLLEDDIVWEEKVEDSELFQILYPLESGQISDLIGTIKVFGHPSISVIEGLTQLEERVHRHLEIDPVTLRNSLGKSLLIT